MRLRFLSRIAFIAGMAIVLAFVASGTLANEQTYKPSGKEEQDILALVVASEVKENGWKQDEFICVSINGLDPSRRLIKFLRERKLRVRSSGEWTKKFNCGFELQLEYPRVDSSETVKVRSRVVDLREINTGQGDLALLQNDGEYLLKKQDGKWSISGYRKLPLQRTATR